MGKIIDVERTGPDTFVRTRLEQEGGRDVLVQETVQTSDRQIVEEAKRAYNDAPERFGEGFRHHVAEIPMIVVVDLARKRNIPWREVLMQNTDRSKALWNDLLNGREFRAFRTRPGHVNVTPRGR
jgi:hypothetical protein